MNNLCRLVQLWACTRALLMVCLLGFIFMVSSSVPGLSSVLVPHLHLWPSPHIQLNMPKTQFFKVYLFSFPTPLFFLCFLLVVSQMFTFFSRWCLLLCSIFPFLTTTIQVLVLPAFPTELDRPFSTRIKPWASKCPFSVLIVSASGCVPLLGEYAVE